jgi:hypothetical protein
MIEVEGVAPEETDALDLAHQLKEVLLSGNNDASDDHEDAS